MESSNSPAPAQSAFVQHLLEYPVINDGVTKFKKNDLGQKSLQLGDSAFKTLAPMAPFLSKPYEYMLPYVKKVDQIGDQTLCKVDQRFPVVKKPTGELYAGAKTIILLPYRKGMEGKDHVLDLYTAQYRKSGGEGLLNHAKSLISTVFIISNETLCWFRRLWSTKKAPSKVPAESWPDN